MLRIMRALKDLARRLFTTEPPVDTSVLCTVEELEAFVGHLVDEAGSTDEKQKWGAFPFENEYGSAPTTSGSSERVVREQAGVAVAE